MDRMGRRANRANLCHVARLAVVPTQCASVPRGNKKDSQFLTNESLLAAAVSARGPTIMSWIGDKAEDAVENKIFEEGGYPAWIKYKAWKAYESCAECCK
ncbi:hypothetical protein ACHAXH_004213 [Discostella pseudostelligera]